MDDQPDDRLSKRIKEVFDHYDDAFAGEGWLELRKKFPPQQQRRRALLWLWPAAALLLLFLGLGIWMLTMENKVPDNRKAANPIKQIKTGQPLSNHHQLTAATNKIVGPQLVYRVKMAQTVAAIKPVQPKNGFAYQSQQVFIAAKGVNIKTVPPTSKANQTNAQLVDTTRNLAAVNTTTPVAVNHQPKIAAADTVATHAAKPTAPKTMYDLFAADAGKPPVELQQNKDKKVRFGVYAATYFNYAKNSNSQVNLGAGFTADIPLSGNLKLVTGLSVNQNTFAYNNSSIGFPGYYNLSGQGSASGTTNGQSANLLGLDIPLDLKYEFSSGKNQLYFLTGLSSGTFINQSYSYTTQSSYPNDFYFGRTLNVAFGLGYPLGKDQLVIEPFLKYPLEGLGAEQLRFGASGINLKFNFSTTKK